MVNLHLERAIRILCLGAHPDDIEIGCGGTILHLLEANPDAEVCWVVFSGTESRNSTGMPGSTTVAVEGETDFGSCPARSARNSNTLAPSRRRTPT